jgi:DNA-binding transcriptional ArsR family regulator
MTDNENELLLEFFKTLADENRLKIVGILSAKAYSVEDLALQLDISQSTVSHHLARLSKAGLVSAKADGYYNVYSLQTDVLAKMAGKILKTEELSKFAPKDEMDIFERKVLKTFLDPNGRIKAFPAQEKKYLVVLRHVLKNIEPDKKYTEKEISILLEHFSNDYSKLRRDLVEFGFLGREGGGGLYWKK